MSTSRRALIGATVTVLTTLVSGCGTNASETCESTPAQSPVVVRLVASDTERTLFDRPAVMTVGTVQNRQGSTAFDVTLSEEAATGVREDFESLDVTDRPDRFEVTVVEEGRVATRFGVQRSLANTITSGDWDGTLQLTFEEQPTAEDLHERFRCG